jgi:hypothetical protein
MPSVRIILNANIREMNPVLRVLASVLMEKVHKDVI